MLASEVVAVMGLMAEVDDRCDGGCGAAAAVKGVVVMVTVAEVRKCMYRTICAMRQGASREAGFLAGRGGN